MLLLSRFSRVRLCATPWIVACQAPLSMDFPSKHTGVSCHFLLQGKLPDLGIEPESPALQANYHLSHQGSPVCLVATIFDSTDL